MTEKLAEAYLDRPRNLNIPTTPGRQLWFNGGKAVIFDVRDITPVLRRDDLTLYPSERYRDWWEDWLNACGEHQPARAKIEVDGVVHEPPYAELLAQASEIVSSISPGNSDQGPVLAAPRRGPGRPPKWVGNESNRESVDPDSGETAGGSHPLDADLVWDNNHPR